MNVKDLLTLSDNNEYVIVSKAIYEDKPYLYLVDINNSENIKFGLERQDSVGYIIDEIEDVVLIQTLLPLFYEASKNMINDLLRNANQSTS